MTVFMYWMILGAVGLLVEKIKEGTVNTWKKIKALTLRTVVMFIIRGIVGAIVVFACVMCVMVVIIICVYLFFLFFN